MDLAHLLSSRLAPVQTVILSHISPAEMMNLLLVSKSVHGALKEGLSATCFNINAKLAKFFHDPKAFRKAQARSGALIGDDFAHKFVANQAPELVQMLDIHVPNGGSLAETNWNINIIRQYLEDDRWTENTGFVELASELYEKKGADGRVLQVYIRSSFPSGLQLILQFAQTTAALSFIAWNKAYTLMPHSNFIDKECFILHPMRPGPLGKVTLQHLEAVSRARIKVFARQGDDDREILGIRRVGDKSTWTINLDIAGVEEPVYSFPDTVIESTMFGIFEDDDDRFRQEDWPKGYYLGVEDFSHPVLKHSYLIPSDKHGTRWSVKDLVKKGLPTITLNELNKLKKKLADLSLIELGKLAVEDRPAQFDEFIRAEGDESLTLTFPKKKVPDTWTYYDDGVAKQLAKIWKQYEEQKSVSTAEGSTRSESSYGSNE